jgi:hypothetical protein
MMAIRQCDTLFVILVLYCLILPYNCLSSLRKLWRSEHRYSSSSMSMTAGNDNEAVVQMLNTVANTISKTSNRSSASNETRNMVMDLRTRFQRTIPFNESTYASRYFSLPISSYSTLDASIIQKRTDLDNTFTIKLPLYSLIFRNSNKNGKAVDLPRQMILDIEVTTDPSNGRITMVSKDIFFSYRKDLPQSSEAIDSHLGNNSESLGLSPPTWLVWNNSINDQRNSDNHDGEIVMLKSSIQAMLDVKVSWPVSNNPSTTGRLALPPKSSWFQRQPTFPVNIDATVNVGVNIPSPKHIADVINFGPCNLLLKQAGKVILKTVVSTVSSSLITLLMQDFYKRKENWAAEESLTQQPQQEDLSIAITATQSSFNE